VEEAGNLHELVARSASSLRSTNEEMRGPGYYRTTGKVRVRVALAYSRRVVDGPGAFHCLGEVYLALAGRVHRPFYAQGLTVL